MDTVTLILTALQVGPLADSIDMQACLSDAAKDAYVSLKSRIQQKLAGKPSTEVVLTEYDTDPKTWEAPLKKALVQARVDQDEDIIEAAQKVMKFAQPQEVAIGKHNLQISSSVQGFAQGDYQNVTTHVGDGLKEK